MATQMMSYARPSPGLSVTCERRSDRSVPSYSVAALWWGAEAIRGAGKARKGEGSAMAWVGVGHGRGFHGHYASFDLKDRRGMFHTNMEKFGDIQDQLVSKIAALAATPSNVGGEAIPLRIDIPPTASIELWDSGLPVSAHAGD